MKWPPVHGKWALKKPDDLGDPMSQRKYLRISVQFFFHVALDSCLSALLLPLLVPKHFLARDRAFMKGFD